MTTNLDAGMNGRAGSADALLFVQEHADSFVDGSLDPASTNLVKQYGEVYPECRREIDLAQQLHDGFRSMNAPPCPENVVDAVFAAVSKNRMRSIRQSFSSALSTLQPVWRPALALATIVVAVVMFTMRPSAPSGYTDAEVEQALREVRWTMAYLGDVGRRTGETIRDDVLTTHVVSPINKTLLATFE